VKWAAWEELSCLSEYYERTESGMLITRGRTSLKLEIGNRIQLRRMRTWHWPKGKTCSVFRAVRIISDKDATSSVSIAKQDGSICNTMDEVLDRWREHYESALNHAPGLLSARWHWGSLSLGGRIHFVSAPKYSCTQQLIRSVLL